MHPAVIVICTFLLCATVLSVAWLLRAPRLDRQVLEQMVDDARSGMERTFAAALEEAAAIGETIKRHRARIDGATRGAPATEQQAPQRQLFELTPAEAARLPRDEQLAYLHARRAMRAQ